MVPKNASILLILLACTMLSTTGQRARDIGIPFEGNPGRFNAITDVKGVEVGFSTIISGQRQMEHSCRLNVLVPSHQQGSPNMFIPTRKTGFIFYRGNCGFRLMEKIRLPTREKQYRFPGIRRTISGILAKKKRIISRNFYLL